MAFYAHLENSNSTVICSLEKIYVRRYFFYQKKKIMGYIFSQELYSFYAFLFTFKKTDISANVFLRSTFFYKYPY